MLCPRTANATLRSILEAIGLMLLITEYSVAVVSTSRVPLSNLQLAALQTSTDKRAIIACFGDSLTEGWGLESGEAYPNQLQRIQDRRRYPYRVINLGLSGDTAQNAVSRPPIVLAEKPSIVVLAFGANDAFRNRPVKSIKADLTTIVEHLQQANALVILAGVNLPRGYDTEYVIEFEAMYRQLANQYGLELIPSLLKGVSGESSLMQPDGLHPNKEGMKIVAESVFQTLEPVMHRQPHEQAGECKVFVPSMRVVEGSYHMRRSKLPRSTRTNNFQQGARNSFNVNHLQTINFNRFP
jgi:acyl-CoA thioesterase I